MKWKDRTVSHSTRTIYAGRNAVKTTRIVAAALFTGIAVLDGFYRIGPIVSGRKASPDVWEPNPNLLFQQGVVAESRPLLKIMTLNAAHGRKEGSHKLLSNRGSARTNLDDVAAVLRRENPDIVALQEVDGPSVWSGMFDHLQYLSRYGGFPYSVMGEHVKGKLNAYGTGLVSWFPLEDTLSIRFSPAPPTFAKGAVVSTVRLPGTSDKTIDVVSLHLDFARRSVRRRQAIELVEKIKNRKRPLIVMGDFNCEWTTGEQTLPFLAHSLGLRAFRPEAKAMTTHPASGRRLDWILLSRGLEFRGYKTLDDPLSDHLAVVAEVALRS